MTHLTAPQGPVGWRGSLGDATHLPRTAPGSGPPRDLGGRPSVVTLSHSDVLRRLPDEPHRAARRAYPNDVWTPSNWSQYLGNALALTLLVVRIAATRMVRHIQNVNDRWYQSANFRRHALFQGHIRHAATLAPAFQA